MELLMLAAVCVALCAFYATVEAIENAIREWLKRRRG